ncbi:nudix hydrolase 9-like [Actinidia eriantha]|uniref:nudix hydrolase 9-like n=1 Tax=Actinidia eriantha TaxID=165200 RepID=UPI00258671EE|nr:nudix hydrolase 9-like [Actinidia eriantha]
MASDPLKWELETLHPAPTSEDPNPYDIGTNYRSLQCFSTIDDCQLWKHTSSPLGNGAAVETSDQRILVLQRSYNVGEFPGHYVFPGGHPEPQEVGIVSHQYDKDSGNTEFINKKISREMFDSIVREVVEEIEVPAASLNELEDIAYKMPGCYQVEFVLHKLMVEEAKNA